MKTRTVLAALAGAGLLAATSGAGAEPLYTLSFLPTGFQGAQINDAGQVVGTAGGAAALYAGGVLTSLAPSPSVGQGINNQGDVTGSLSPVFDSRAFTYVDGTLTNIHPFVASDDVESYGVAINDQGAVGGNIYSGGENNRGFIYRNGTVEYIGTFGGDYSPLAAINNNGAATGYAAFEGPAGGYYHAYVYQNGTLQDLGTLLGDAPGLNSAGTDINDLGEVVGWSPSASASFSPFLYSGGRMIDLGTLGGIAAIANALNDAGAVVGFSDLTASGNDAHAFLYANGRMVDLNALVAGLGGWQLTNAQDINESGQILATACQNGDCASVLLTPVPEPAAGLMLLAGLGALLALAARGRRHAPRARGALGASGCSVPVP